ncbi:MAG: PilZ domain-containing protein [SAR324 cluster bacterium]|nr:PilZ domain-containing protein [SAR324 cluster bacterium]
MARESIDQAYDALLQRRKEESGTEAPDRSAELRSHPRFNPTDERVAIRLESEHQVLNVSEAGIAFASRIPYDVGQVIDVNFIDLARIDAQVVECRVDQADPRLLEVHYVVRCEFLGKDKGREFLELINA